jgi:Fe-S oxidoreductase
MKDVFARPRSAIQSGPGIRFREMALNRRFAYCCGSGGGVTGTAYSQEAAWYARKRILQATEVAKRLVTACPRGHEQLGQAAREAGVSVEVLDISQFLNEAIGL